MYLDQPAEPLQRYPSLALKLVLPPIMNYLLLFFLLSIFSNANLKGKEHGYITN
jgi:hypothetical protein